MDMRRVFVALVVALSLAASVVAAEPVLYEDGSFVIGPVVGCLPFADCALEVDA